jgi:hypothetical protein
MQCFPKLINNTAKVCCEKVSVGLRNLIFHIHFEPLGFVDPVDPADPAGPVDPVDPVKLFEKRLACFCLKTPEEICDPYFKFSLNDSFYLLKISLNAPSLVVL